MTNQVRNIFITPNLRYEEIFQSFLSDVRDNPGQVFSKLTDIYSLKELNRLLEVNKLMDLDRSDTPEIKSIIHFLQISIAKKMMIKKKLKDKRTQLSKARQIKIQNIIVFNIFLFSLLSLLLGQFMTFKYFVPVPSATNTNSSEINKPNSTMPDPQNSSQLSTNDSLSNGSKSQPKIYDSKVSIKAFIITALSAAGWLYFFVLWLINISELRKLEEIYKKICQLEQSEPKA